MSVAQSTSSIPPDRSTVAPQSTLQSLFGLLTMFETKWQPRSPSKLTTGLRLSMSNDEGFLRRVAATLEHELRFQDHVFALATTSTSQRKNPKSDTLLICGAPEHYVQRAVLLASSKLMGRISVAKTRNDGTAWAAVVRDIGGSSYDESTLWDVVRKSARVPIDPLAPPPGSRSIDRVLSDARAKLQRLTPAQAYAELREPEVGAPAFLVDIRPAEERAREGMIHGSLIVECNVLEWRFDPRSPDRLLIVDRYDLGVIVSCGEGDASSQAALSLQELGLLNATDVVGGYRAWRDAGLPVDMSESTPTQPSVIEIIEE